MILEETDVLHTLISGLDDAAVQVGGPQNFTPAQQTQARTNINAAEAVQVLNATRSSGGAITWDRPDVTPQLIAELKPRVILHTGDNILDMNIAYHADGSLYRMTHVMAMDNHLDVRRLIYTGTWTYQSFQIAYTA